MMGIHIYVCTYYIEWSQRPMLHGKNLWSFQDKSQLWSPLQAEQLMPNVTWFFRFEHCPLLGLKALTASPDQKGREQLPKFEGCPTVFSAWMVQSATESIRHLLSMSIQRPRSSSQLRIDHPAILPFSHLSLFLSLISFSNSPSHHHRICTASLHIRRQCVR